jgi:hypothetical protein
MDWSTIGSFCELAIVNSQGTGAYVGDPSESIPGKFKRPQFDRTVRNCCLNFRARFVSLARERSSCKGIGREIKAIMRPPCHLVSSKPKVKRPLKSGLGIRKETMAHYEGGCMGRGCLLINYYHAPDRVVCIVYKCMSLLQPRRQICMRDKDRSRTVLSPG